MFGQNNMFNNYDLSTYMFNSNSSVPFYYNWFNEEDQQFKRGGTAPILDTRPIRTLKKNNANNELKLFETNEANKYEYKGFFNHRNSHNDNLSGMIKLNDIQKISKIYNSTSLKPDKSTKKKNPFSQTHTGHSGGTGCFSKAKVTNQRKGLKSSESSTRNKVITDTIKKKESYFINNQRNLKNKLFTTGYSSCTNLFKKKDSDKLKDVEIKNSLVNSFNDEKDSNPEYKNEFGEEIKKKNTLEKKKMCNEVASREQKQSIENQRKLEENSAEEISKNRNTVAKKLNLDVNLLEKNQSDKMTDTLKKSFRPDKFENETPYQSQRDRTLINDCQNSKILQTLNDLEDFLDCKLKEDENYPNNEIPSLNKSLEKEKRERNPKQRTSCSEDRSVEKEKDLIQIENHEEMNNEAFHNESSISQVNNNSQNNQSGNIKMLCDNTLDQEYKFECFENEEIIPLDEASLKMIEKSKSINVNRPRTSEGGRRRRKIVYPNEKLDSRQTEPSDIDKENEAVLEVERTRNLTQKTYEDFNFDEKFEIQNNALEYIQTLQSKRPPCRKKVQAFNLETGLNNRESNINFNNPSNIQKLDFRPPSRHKTPRKAIGLDIPASNQHTFPIKNMYINYDTNEDDSFIKHLRNTGDNYKYDFDDDSFTKFDNIKLDNKVNLSNFVEKNKKLDISKNTISKGRLESFRKSKIYEKNNENYEIDDESFPIKLNQTRPGSNKSTANIKRIINNEAEKIMKDNYFEYSSKRKETQEIILKHNKSPSSKSIVGPIALPFETSLGNDFLNLFANAMSATNEANRFA